jgi:NAD-dependent dihydropyrimidine dehydrogenase PreA subunit
LEIYAPGTLTIEVYIDKHWCCECGTCIGMCSMGVFDHLGKTFMPVRMHVCCTCLKCSDFCPTHAISTSWTLRA